MNDDELPDDVLAAIHANRKIEAIKLLREQRGLGLKEAKQAVDAYAARHPDLIAVRNLQSEGTGGRLLLIGLVIAGLYVAYRILG